MLTFHAVSASLTDYYQYYIDNGILALNAPGATIVNVCDGIDQDGDGAGICFDDENGDGVMFGGEEQLPFNTCTVCGENGGTPCTLICACKCISYGSGSM